MASDPHVPAGEPGQPAASLACPICGTPQRSDQERCAECGCHLAAARQRPFTARALWALVAVFVACYLLTVVVVAAARS
jgi:predicted nucleic acid-binding Zn ribbon protein